MQAIQATIKPDDTGPQVANLYAALQFLIEKGVFASLTPPELAALKDQLRSEEPSGFYKGAAVTLVKVFQAQFGLDGTLGGLVEDQTADLLNQRLKKYGAFDTGTDFVVRGTVKDTNGSPQGGLAVIAFDRDLRRWQELGRAATDPLGKFEIPYRYESFRQAEGVVKPEVDLVLQVARRLENDGLEPIHVHEEPKPVPPVASIEIVLPAVTEPGPTEFERATAIKPLLIGQGQQIAVEILLPVPPSSFVAGPPPIDFGGLRANDLMGGLTRYADLSPDQIDDSDVAFIVRETELGSEVVRAWAESARWQQQALHLLGADAQPGDVATINVLGWPFFFAWIRAGQSPGMMGVLRSEAQAWLSVQRNGEALARIPPVSTENWKLLVTVLQELARLAVVDDTLNSGEPLVEMLRQSPDALPRELKLDVLDIYLTEGLGNPDAFLKLADKHPTAAKELGLFVRTLRLNDLTGGQAPLIGALNKHLGNEGDSIRALADLGAAKWGDLVKKAAGQGFAVDATLYATVAVGLQLRVEQLHPVPALIARIGDDSVKLADSDLVGALRNVLTTHGDAADALLKGVNLDSPAVKAIDNLKVIDTLRNFGRFGRLGLGFQGAADLYMKGIPNPGHLMRYGSGQIRNMLLNKYPQEIVDAFTNNVTNAVADITSMVATGIPLNPGIFGGAGDGAATQPPVVQQITAPTVRGMFGDLDECMCRPCESVLGLPAYLVDLLNLLDKTGATPFTSGLERTALDLLKSRRPSILTMPLSCENAEAEELHIDLALEVLEEAVPASAGAGLTPAARALQGARFPWTLPFNAADTDLALCMERLGATRQDLMSLVAAPTASARAAAALGLSDDERQIIAEQPTANANWWEHWGFASNDRITIDDPASNEAIPGTPLELLRPASVLMARTGLDLEALETALATDFVGGLVFDERGQCKTSKMHLPTQATLTSAPFDRLHRFTRLQRKLTGWNAAVLDSALKHLSTTQAPNPLLLDGDTLNGIAQIKRAAEVLQLPPEVVLALRAWPGETRVSLNLADRTKDETLFDRVFSSKRQADQQVFAAFKQPSATPADLITSKADAIAAAIGMDPREIAKHAAAAGETISHASLSWLYRRHTLSQALGLSIDQLLRLMQVTGIDPFLSPATTTVDRAQGFAALSALAQASRQVADCGLPFDLGMALLQPDAPSAELPAGLRTAQQVDDWLEELKRALQAVPEPTDLHVDAAQLQDPIKSLLSPLFKEDVVRAVMAELVSPSRVLDTAVFKALTGRLAHTALPEPSLLLSEDEAKLLLTPDSAGRWGRNERFAFVYERLLEHTGDVVRRVEGALAGLLPSGQVRLIMDALHDAASPSSADATRALSTPAVVGKTFGVGRALFMDRRAAEALFSSPPQPPQTRIPRYREVLENIAAMQREQAFLDAVARWTGWPEVSLAPFVGERLTIEPISAGPARLAKNFYLDPAFWSASAPPLALTDAAAAQRWARRLDRLTVLFNQSEAASAWQALQGLDWRDLIEPDAASTPSWSTRAGLLDLLWLARPENLSLNVLVEHFKRVSMATGSLLDRLVPLALRLNIQPSVVHDLAQMARTEPALPTAVTVADLTKPYVLRATYELTTRARHLMATPAQISTLVGIDLTAAARLARQLLAAQVGADAWPARIQPIDDALRKQRRDALVAWLLQNDTVVAPTQNRKPWTHSGQIYEHYLIDPEVQPCMRTTPILQAVAAVQLFVQRILFGLEKEVTDSSLLRERWTWMRSYRLWEANRKVFLYPENWLFPELRDDKSSSFKQLEAALGQGELTADLANQAFGKFLDDVAQIGQMQVVGMFEDVEWDNPTPPATRKRTRRDLYVVGRTPNPPYRYFWRKCADFGQRWMEWSPWQRIDVGIQGEHVLPLMLGKDLHVAWISFDAASQASSILSRQVTVHWARFDGRSWTHQASSDVKATLPLAPGLSERRGVVLRGTADRVTRSAELYLFSAGAVPGTRADLPADDLPGPGDNYTNEARQFLTWKVWIKLKSSDGITLYVDSTSDRELYVRGGQPVAVNGNSYSYRHTPELDIAASSAYVRAKVDGRWKLSSWKAIAGVSKGQTSYLNLHFEIDATDLGKSAEELGMLSIGAAQWELRKVYRLGSRRSGAWLEPAATMQLSAIANTEPVATGFVERKGSSGGVTLEDPRRNLSARIFANTAAPSFRLVGAAAHCPPGSLLPSLAFGDAWYFDEAGGRCYLDLATPEYPPYATFRLFSDGYSGALAYRDESHALDELSKLQAGDFDAQLLPTPGGTIRPDTWPVNGDHSALFFDNRLPYSCDNWEVFLHAPLSIAHQLMRQHKFEDAERWLRFVFDPTRVSTADPKAFLRFRVFHELNPGQTVAAELTALARAAAGVATTVDVEAIKALIDRWRALPFRPFLIARRRHLAFLWRTLFAYLDNLITWADSLYRRDTRESIGEATLLYVLAARILGPRPRVVGSRRTQSARSFEALRSEWDDFANAWVDTTPPPRNSGGLSRGASGSQLSNDSPPPPEGFLHFCIPVNDKLLTYWNSVEERLFNIRHCRNIEGIPRDLPLLEPPIDPELLVRATAAGLDIGAILSDLYAPLPNHRFSLLAARATELASETRSLGAAMLAALEKRDTEKLGLLRSSHEINLHKLVGAVRKLQIEEAEKSVEALRASRRLTVSKYQQYGRLLGKTNAKSPEPGDGMAEDSMLGIADKSGEWGLLSHETEQLANLSTARTLSDAESVTRTIAAVGSLAASVAHFVAASTAGPVRDTWDSIGKGASSVTGSVNSIADVMRALGQGHQSLAGIQATTAGHIRRRDEWAFQSNQTLKELDQIDKQILANKIRIDITKRELDNQTVQIEQAAAIDEYLRSKYTNAELYDWMVSQLSALHSGAYRMALEMARKAQKSAARELGLSALDLIRNDHWDSLRSGLLAGERLYQDIKRLEITYLEQSRREYELTKHVSLRRLDPEALVDLISTGACNVDIPEWLFDMDTPGHYMRRIKTVSVSIPCVIGPYASVNCKLTLLKSETRHAPSSSDGYAKRTAVDDPRFTVRYGAAESIVTSTGRDDSGLFETALRDERYLPFESAGVISSWRIELPGTPRQFDIDTISDVILHLRYTARDGGDGLKALAQQQFAGQAGAAPTYPKVLLSCRSEFPNEWNAAKANKTSLKIGLSLSLLPYWMQTQGLNLKIKAISTLVLPASSTVEPTPKVIDGSGIADVGSVEVAEDLFVLLDVG